MNQDSCPNCLSARKTIQEWADLQGHDRCWYYPDLFQKLVKAFGVTASKSPQLPPRKEFEEGCKRYQEEEYTRKS